MIWMEKQILRAKMRAAVKRSAVKALASQHIRNHLRNSEFWKRAEIIFGYVALAGEPDWLGEHIPDDKLIAYPRVEENGMLSFFYSGGEFALGALGVKHPVGGTLALSPDLAIIPGLAFDPRGGRLGRGKGFYDRWLGANPGVNTLGICFKCQIVENVPAESHDARVDAVLTEEGFILP
jgi:5-formyltetrahydrofolate cyclo-ligase